MFKWLRGLFGRQGAGRRRRNDWRNDFSGQKAEPDPQFGPYTNARDWFRGNQHAHPLASNRFHGRSDAEAFLEEMYRLGAVRVLVGNVTDEPEDGGQYADLLVAEIPFDLPVMDAFLKLWEKEFGRMDDYQASSTLLYFWWD